jgi:surface carbohydrate biosynthesis protein
LGGAVLLANVLAARGVETVLIPLYDQSVDVPLLRLDALVINFARAVNRPLVEAYHAMDLPIWVLDTEGGILAETGGNAPNALAASIGDSGYADLLTGYFFWGSTLRDAFVASSGMASETLHLTGCPRFDLTAAPWRGVLASPQPGYILANANFPLVNSLFGLGAASEKAAMVESGWDADYVDALIADLEGICRRFIETIHTVARKFPDQSILVRPHPFENARRYEEAFATYSNVTVDGSGSVLDVIANARCILHVNCGTAVEALRLDVLPLSLEFINTERMRAHSMLPYRASLNVSSIDTLLDTIARLDETTARFDFADVYRTTCERWFYYNDGCASARIADVLVAAISKTPARAKRSFATSLRSARRAPSWAQRLQAIAANLMGSRAISRLRTRAQPRRAAKTITRDAVYNLSARFANHARIEHPAVTHAHHPLTGLPLASLIIRPDGRNR